MGGAILPKSVGRRDRGSNSCDVPTAGQCQAPRSVKGLLVYDVFPDTPIWRGRPDQTVAIPLAFEEIRSGPTT